MKESKELTNMNVKELNEQLLNENCPYAKIHSYKVGFYITKAELGINEKDDEEGYSYEFKRELQEKGTFNIAECNRGRLDAIMKFIHWKNYFD